MLKKLVNIHSIAPCLFALIIDYAGFGIIYPIVTSIFSLTNPPFFPHHVSAENRDFYMGLSFLLYPLFMFFGSSFLGDLSDFWGRKKVFLISMLGISFGFVFMTLGIELHNLFFFLFGRALTGLMAGSQPLTQATISDLSTPANKVWNMAFVTLVGGISINLGPFFAGLFSEQVFLQRFGFSFPFIFSALMAILAFFWILFGFEETLSAKRKGNIDFMRPFTLFLQAFSNKKVRYLAFIFLLFQTGFGLYYQFISYYLISRFHYTSAKLGFFYGFIGVTFILGILVILPYALKHFKITKITAVSLFLMSLFQILAMLYVNETYLWLLVLVIGPMNTISYAGFLTQFSNAEGPKNQGWVLGILAATMAASFVLTGLATNLLTLIDSRILISIGGIIALIAAGMMYQKAFFEASS